VIVTEAVRTGFIEIWSHKMRSFLSFSAIAFGVAAILYTFSEVHGMAVRRQKAFDLAGPGRLEISMKDEYVSRGLSKGLTLGDAQAIRAAVPTLHMVSPTVTRWGTDFVYGTFRSEDIGLIGITTEWARRDWVYTVRGRFFDEHDMRTAARVCLIVEPGGWDEKPFWAKYFPKSKFETFIKHNDLLGKTVRLEDHLYTVVGILKEPPRDKDPRWFSRRFSRSTIYVPITSYHRYVGSRGKSVSDRVGEIIVDTGDEKTVPYARRVLEALLTIRHRGETDFEVEDFRDTIQGVLNQTRQYAIAVMAVGIVAILAGGVGIMNVTLATIFSRVREIGIRRAVGATRRDILTQFVIEAMLLGFFGGIAGISLGLTGITYIAAKGMRGGAEPLVWWHLLATLGISVGAGFLFSLYPAYQASKMDPVEALRYE